MINELAENKVYYKIFDKNDKRLSYLYGKYKTNDHIKITEIEQNLNVVLSEFHADNILILKQVHGSNIVDADEIIDFKIEPEADGAVTSKNGIILSIQSADCVPILMTSADAQVIGVVHSGWKSAKLGIIEKLVNKMKEKGGKDLVAVVGPSIQQSSYEVDKLFYDNFIDSDSSSEQFFITSKNDNHHMFDLPGFVEYKLKQLGVIVHRIIEDTYTKPDQYPSYRRSCHLNVPSKHEHILSTIMIRN